MTKRLAVLVFAAALYLLTSLAAAQVDPRAAALFEALAPANVGEVQSIEQTITTTMFGTAEEMVVGSHTVIDFVNRRALIVQDLAAGMSTRIMLKDGNITMQMSGLPMNLPVPPGTAEQLDSMFDQPTEAGVFKEGDVVTYDGAVDYDGILVGEQVSYTSASDPENTLHFVFANGAIVGMHSGDGETAVLIIMDQPLSSQNLVGYSSTTYTRDGAGWSKVAHTLVTDVKINEPLDESLFD